MVTSSAPSNFDCTAASIAVIPPPITTTRRPIGSPDPAAASRFVVPDLPTDWAPPTSMSVTDFRHYLECPYRYALSRIGRLKEMEDAAREMTAGQFGDLAHGVLKQFGRDESIRDVIEEERLREYLLDQLHTQSKEMFGLSPAVQVQIVRLEDRLAAFAREQAKMRQQGWRIIHAERDFKDPERDLLMMDGGDPPMPLRATIDRIDYNEAERRCRIIDYKTGDRAKTLYEAHHGSRKKQDRWIDLQLPLYDMLARRTLDCERCELAYMLLPKKPGDTKLDIAEWTVEDLDGAISQAREVVRDIRAGRLPRNPDYNPPWDPFARICQTNVFTAAAVGDAMAGEAGDGNGGGSDG